MKFRVALFALALFTTSHPAAKAEGWFAGVEGGWIEHTYQPTYFGPDGGRATASFTNKSEGFELGLFAGYEFVIAERLTLPIALRGTWNDSEWTLFIPWEPARFTYEIPYTFGLVAQPTFMLTDRLGIFLEGGLLTGRIHQEKRSPSADRSSYDFDSWEWALGLGGGIRYQLSENLNVSVSYRKNWFDEIDYLGRLPSGRSVERITDEPESQSVLLALSYRF